MLFKKWWHLPAQVPAVSGNKHENWLWQKEISLSVPPWAGGEQPAGSPSDTETQQPGSPPLLSLSPLLLSASGLPSFFSAHLAVCVSFCWRFLANPNLFTSHHDVYVKVPSGVMRGLGCCHINCCCNYTSSFSSLDRLTITILLIWEGLDLNKRSRRCFWDS